MALVAEQLLEEWMNRQRFFTVRGIKSGVDEIDLLGIRPKLGGGLDAWHVEVQVSFNPNAYISKISKGHMGELAVLNRNSAKRRTDELLTRTVTEWVEGKFKSPKKRRMREARWPDLYWEYWLVHGRVKHPQELALIEQGGVKLLPFQEVLAALGEKSDLRGHSGTDIVDVLEFFMKSRAEPNL